MRYLTLLNATSPKKTAKLSDTDKGYHIYDPVLYRKYQLMTDLYKNDDSIQQIYRKMVIISHPFEVIKTMITTRCINNCKPMKMTNAYMKMYEFLIWLDDNGYLTFKNNEFNMFDVAGAPGMFVIATDNYLQKKYPTINYHWKACSLEGGTALTDMYGLYAANPDNYTPCDVLKVADIKKCITKKKYDLVTGDIGIYHEDNYDKLQEENQLDLEWGQMILALNNVKENGHMFLKMYSLTTFESIYLLDTLTKYFDKIMITKPYCTRIFNDECYIICINRNNKACNHEPLTRPYLKSYTSPNLDLVKSFEYSRLEIKYRMLTFIKKLYDNMGYRATLEDFKKNYIYKIFFDEFHELFDLFDTFDL